jgi:hypothetical protein
MHFLIQKMCLNVFCDVIFLSSREMTVWCLKPWNVVKKFVGSNLILSIHH